MRSAVVCDHVDTACPDCLDSWEYDHELRIAATPATVDLDTHRGAADEFYTFEGDPERQAPAYWVARHGRTVTSQIADEPVRTVLQGNDDFASAEFADGCCDDTPGAPGEIRPGDQIEVLGDRSSESNSVVVTGSVATSDGYAITGTGHDGESVSITVKGWGYRITRRPVSVQSGLAGGI